MLRMMGIPISGPTYIYGENIISNPELLLKMKCNAIAYHGTCKYLATRKSSTGHIRSEDNLADLLRKDINV